MLYVGNVPESFCSLEVDLICHGQERLAGLLLGRKHIICPCTLGVRGRALARTALAVQMCSLLADEEAHQHLSAVACPRGRLLQLPSMIGLQLSGRKFHPLLCQTAHTRGCACRQKA